MEGFDFIVSKIDRVIPVYSLVIRCTGLIMLIKGFLSIRYIFDGETLMKLMEGFLSDSILYETGGGRLIL